jgi:hypothetical protein
MKGAESVFESNYNVSKEGVTYSCKRKILVTGPNASGTSFVALLLARLGHDSGFDDKYFAETVEGEKGKGVEFLTYRPTLRKHRRHWNQKRMDISPRLIKKPINPRWEDQENLENPRISNVITFVDRFGWEVDHIILTIRDLDSWKKASVRHDTLHRPEVRPKFQDKHNPEQWMGYGWTKTYTQILERGYPHSVLLFPKCIDNAEYCFEALKPVVIVHKEKFMEIHSQIADPSRVHVR